jgi:hypothetical protein
MHGKYAEGKIHRIRFTCNPRRYLYDMRPTLGLHHNGSMEDTLVLKGRLNEQKHSERNLKTAVSDESLEA